MSTQRRENRSTPATTTCRRGPRYRRQRTRCAESDGASRLEGLASSAWYDRAAANGGTARPIISACFDPSDQSWSPGWKRLATNSLQLDYRMVRLVWLGVHDFRHGTRSSPPLGVGRSVDPGTPATHRLFLSFTPSPSGFARIHPSSPFDPAGQCRWTERYDGKRNMHFQHAA